MMRQELITSVQNQQVKQWHQLLSRKGREETGRFLVEGVHLVTEALRSDREVLALIYDADRGLPRECEEALNARQHAVKRIAVSPQVMDKISETKSPQGVIAELKKSHVSWEQFWSELAKRQEFLLLVADEIQDPGNMGTILRTADAAGVDAVIVGEGSVDLYNGKVVRSTMGSLFRMPVFTRNISEALQEIKQAGGKALVTSLGRDSKPYTAHLYAGKCVIVVGNEGRGVSAEAQEMADELVHIPLYGGAESLNAAVATGIMLYEAQRQRKNA